MATTTHTQSGGAARRTALSLLLLSLVVAPVSILLHHSHESAQAIAGEDDELDGRDARMPDSKRPKIEAAFPLESYKPGAVAQLRISPGAANVTVQIWHAGARNRPILANDVMDGRPVAMPIRIGDVSRPRTLAIRMGNWPSGLYFARLTGDGARVGFAPFVLAPKRLGEHRVAIVLPTQAWQAYNFRDDDGDGVPNTWYASRDVNTVSLGRPFRNRGVPTHYKFYDDPFQRWLIATRKHVDELSDADLDAVGSAQQLAKAYDLIVFPGHHEYVTQHEYDLIEGYRNLGGNLMWLSANNFFWRVDRHGSTITRIARWRDLGRPEAALIGVQYFMNDRGEHRGGWVVRPAAEHDQWIFSNAGVEVGSKFGSGGIEADATTSDSPRNVKVIAEIPDLYGPGLTAQMSYYDTEAGAKVFAAGAFSLATGIWTPQVQQIVSNLWDRLAQP